MREGKALKERVELLEKKCQDQQNTIDSLNTKYEEIKAENEELTKYKQKNEESSKDINTIEKEV